MIKRIIKKLFLTQLIIFLLVCLLVSVFGKISWLYGLAAGMLVGMSGTFLAMVMFRRMPVVVGAKQFFTAMIVYETMKWIVVIVEVALFSKIAQPFGIVVGFVVMQATYFWLLVRD